nr:phage portal protein [Steroidobacteraceae bacterium]
MGFWNRFRRKPAPQKGHVNPTFTAARAFAGAKVSHLTAGWVPVSSSADMESFASLTRLRDRSRALVRDNAHAKRARSLIQNNVIGCGIGMQSQIVNNRGRLLDEINSPIEQA